MDGLYLKAGGGIHKMAVPPINGEQQLRLSETASSSSSSSSSPRNLRWGFTFFRHPLRSFWPPAAKNRYEPAIALNDAAVLVEDKQEDDHDDDDVDINQGRKENWVFKILHVKSLWKNQLVTDHVVVNDDDDNKLVEEENILDNCDVCEVDDDDDDAEKIEFNRESFSKLLQKVPLPEARLIANMSYLGSLAYSIPQIKPGNLLRNHGLSFVTSSLEKKELALNIEKDQVSAEAQQNEAKALEAEEKPAQTTGSRISASATYQIAASAASYLHYHTKSLLPFKSCENEESLEQVSKIDMVVNQDMASLMATTDSVTAVVAAKEEVKQAVADDLNSIRSSPCDWFICDDHQAATRFFVIQGSESLASWQANLLFEPVQFEGLDILVHRGIYEAAKGIYEQMLPEVLEHLKRHGDRAKLRFTGHSLGGSLSLLVNLMLLMRGDAPRSSLLPVITFGAPSIMCGGDLLLRRLGLPRNHVRSITMHRDIVPRAFSCNYPKHVAELLKAVNGNFRSLPCLNKQKLLYAPMGEFLILQPDEKFSPNHDLLPSGSGLYVMTCSVSDIAAAEKQVRAAQAVFLNSPHPLEILSDRSAYGSEGTIQRDHDMNSYLKSVRNVIRQDLNRIRKAKREHRRKVWWPMVAPRGGIIVGRAVGPGSLMGQGQLNFSGIIQTGRESLKRFSTLVASQHMHLFVVFLLPARLLVLGTCCLVNFN